MTTRASTPILVTGSNRSGTTWVGRMLALAPDVAYLHEPFNPSVRPPLLDVGLEGHFTYVTAANEAMFLGPVTDLARFRSPMRRQIASARTPVDAARIARSWYRAASARARDCRPLLKDPLAIFAAPWLAERFGMQVVMMIRHPAGYVSSIRRLGWSYDFSFLLRQDELMRDHLEPFRAELQEFAERPRDPFDQAILLWKIMYTFVDRCRTVNPGWQFIRHEDLSASPVAGFASIYEHLGLRFDKRIAEQIAAFTSEDNAADRPVSERHNVRRDSRQASGMWRARLTPDEVTRIRDGVGPVANRFYDETTW